MCERKTSKSHRKGHFGPEYPILPKIGTSHGHDGGLCVGDCCVKTSAVSPKDTVSLRNVSDGDRFKLEKLSTGAVH